MAPKVKMFMWRLVSNCLPLAENLVRRGLMVDLICCVCGKDMESLLSCFFYCSCSKFPFKLNSIQTKMDLWKSSIELFSVLCWMIWRNRNRTFLEYCCNHPRLFLMNIYRVTGERSESRAVFGQAGHPLPTRVH